MKITVWTLASDDDNGLQAQVFATEAEAEKAKVEAVFTDEDNKAEYLALVEDGDEDAAFAYMENYLSGSLDTYSIDCHTLDVEPNHTVDQIVYNVMKRNHTPEELAKMYPDVK